MRLRSLLLSAGLVSVLLCPPGTASAAIADWQRGFSFSGNYDTEYASQGFRDALAKLPGMNANYVTLVIPYRQSNVHSTDITRMWNTPTDASLISAIDYAHSLGLHVNLKVHMYSDDGAWGVYIDAGDRATWFKNYRDVILIPLATLAQAHGVEQITIGSELEHMSSDWINGTNSQNWRSMIGAVRAIFSGSLTFNAQHDSPNEKDGIAFWDALDYIGVSGYHESGLGDDNPSEAQLQGAWTAWNNGALHALEQRFNKPLIFTEGGFKSNNGSHKCPGCWWLNNGYDPQEQVDQYTAVFETFKDDPNFRGMQFWNFLSDPNAGGNGNTDYTPQNKPAENVIRTYFGQGGGGGGGPISSSSSSSSSTTSSSSSNSSVPAGTAFEAAATVPSTAPSGQAVNGVATITNKSTQTVNGGIADVEVVDPNGNRTFQSFTENLSFAPSQSQSVNFSWTPTMNGNHTVKVGVFANAWATLLTWNDEAAKVNVGGSASSSSTSTSSSNSSTSSSSSSSSTSTSSSSSSSSTSSSSSSSSTSSSSVAPSATDVSIQKVAPPQINRGDVIRYGLIVRNNGGVQASNVKIQDVVPSDLTFVQGLTDSPCALQGNAVVCPNITLNPGEQKQYMVGFTVSANAICGGRLRNTATVSMPGDTNGGNNQGGPTSTLITCPAGTPSSSSSSTTSSSSSSSSMSTSSSSSSSSTSSTSSTFSSSSSSTSSSSSAPANRSLDIWWPTDGSSIQGLQPFKAMLTDSDVSQYHMYWRVDGGVLNEMGDSNQDYPHKESLVDVGPWTWQGAGSYLLDFIAKDLGGADILSKTVSIFVTH